MQRRAINTSRVREWFLSHPWQWVDTRTLELLEHDAEADGRLF